MWSPPVGGDDCDIVFTRCLNLGNEHCARLVNFECGTRAWTDGYPVANERVVVARVSINGVDGCYMVVRPQLTHAERQIFIAR